MTASANRIPLSIRDAVADLPASAALLDLFPAAVRVSHTSTEQALDRVRETGRTVSCRAGCAACCRELISISLVEAIHLAAVVEAMPEERRLAVRERFAAAQRRLEDAGLLTAGSGPPRSLNVATQDGVDRGHTLRWLSRNYFSLGLACPLLEDETCSAYADRPMVCREYHVTSPAEWCAKMNEMPVEGVLPAVGMSPVLAHAAAKAGLPLVQVPLVLALEWAAAFGPAARRTRDGDELGRALIRAAEELVTRSELPPPDPAAADDTATATIDLTIRSRPLRLQVSVPAGPTPPTTLLPLALKLVDTAVAIAAADSATEGKPVSCREGCAACCRHPVPLGESEARRLAATVADLPEPQRSRVSERFAATRRRLAEVGLAGATRDTGAWADDQHLGFGAEYIAARIDCPLLEDEACSIYADRPLVCREFLVTSPPEHCADPYRGGVERLPLPFGSVFRSFARAGANQPDGAPIAWVLLANALEWAAAHPEPHPDRTGPEVLRSVIGHMTGGAAPSSPNAKEPAS